MGDQTGETEDAGSVHPDAMILVRLSRPGPRRKGRLPPRPAPSDGAGKGG